MGYDSKVKMMMGLGAFKELKNIMSCSDSVYNFIIEADNYYIIKDRVTMHWGDVRWHTFYHYSDEFRKFIDYLDDIVLENDKNLQDYFYKIIIVGEDYEIEEITNDENDKYVGLFYTENLVTDGYEPDTLIENNIIDIFPLIIHDTSIINNKKVEELLSSIILTV